MNVSGLTRRSALALAVAVPAAVVSATTAQAKRRPTLGSAPSLTLGTKAQVVPAANGKAAGLRLSVTISEGEDPVEWYITHLYVDEVRISDIEPSLFVVESQQTFPTVVRPVTATGTVSVVLGYARGDGREVLLPATKVTVLPAQAQAPKRR